MRYIEYNTTLYACLTITTTSMRRTTESHSDADGNVFTKQYLYGTKSMDGDETEHDAQGRLVFLQQWENGEEHGMFQRWRIVNGRRRLVHRCVFRRGKEHGRECEWYVGGAMLIERNWNDGKLHGPLTIWTPERRVVLRQQWENGVRAAHQDFGL